MTEGQPAAVAGGQDIPVRRRLGLAVTGAVLFPPIGLYGLYQSLQVRPRQRRGDIPGAVAASKSVRTWATVAAGVGVAVALLFLAFTLIRGGALDRLGRAFFNTELMIEAIPQLLGEGLKNTLLLAIGSVGIGVVLGLLLALVGISKRWWVRLPAVIFIDIFRGLPAIVTIFLVGFGLPLAGLRIFGRNQYGYAVMALGLISTAYMAEIFRAGIQSVDKGQMEAARSVGMSYFEAMRLVIVPQAVRRVLPPLTNEFIAITKDTSLVFVLGLALGQREIFRVGQNISQQNANYSPLIAAALAYLLITVPLTRFVNFLDRRLREGKEVAAEELPATVSGAAG